MNREGAHEDRDLRRPEGITRNIAKQRGNREWGEVSFFKDSKVSDQGRDQRSWERETMVTVNQILVRPHEGHILLLL